MGDFREKLKRVESLDVLKTSLQEIAIDFVRKEKKKKWKNSKMSKSGLVFLFNSQS